MPPTKRQLLRTLSLWPTNRRQHSPERTSHSRTAAARQWDGLMRTVAGKGGMHHNRNCWTGVAQSRAAAQRLTCPIGGAGGEVVAVGVPPHHIHVRCVACTAPDAEHAGRTHRRDAAGKTQALDVSTPRSNLGPPSSLPRTPPHPPTNRRSGWMRSVLHKRAVWSAPAEAK